MLAHPIFLLTMHTSLASSSGMSFLLNSQVIFKQSLKWHSTLCMNIGYARVSTQDQTLNLQKDALKKIGCNKIFTDTASGAKAERTGLNEALEYLREGDTLVV